MYVCMYVCMYYVCMYVCMYVCVYVCMCICIYVCMCFCMYVYMHHFCSITTITQNFVLKYLCNFITKLHNVINSVSTDSYCSCCSVLTCYNNVNWLHNELTVCSELSVPFCTAIRNYKATHYTISKHFKTRHRHLSTLNSVWFLSVRSGTATNSVISLAFRAASGILVVYMYINCRPTVILKCLNTAMFVARCSVTFQLNTFINLTTY